MEKVKEEMLEKLRDIKETAQNDLKYKAGYEKYNVKNVTHYNKKVELVNKETGETELFDLCVILAEDPDTKEILEIYYLNGEEADFEEIMRKYESASPIKDVIDATKENEDRTEEEKDEELAKEELEELEAEKEEEEKEKKAKEQEKQEQEKNKNKQQEKVATENDLTGKKTKYVLQTIDIDKTYVDNLTTVRKGFKLPAGVKRLAIAKPMQQDENVLSSDMTMYMLDANGRIVQDVNGKTIKDFFEVDKSTGKNPMGDDNTKLELDGYAEQNKGQTMRRFKSKNSPNLYLSAEQKKIGDYVQVYAGRKTKDGNDSVEVQLETDNVGIQTSLEMQKIAAGYKGIYNIEDIDKEADEHKEHGDDEENIPIENADGKEDTLKLYDSPYIPETEKTWEELSEETGEGIPKLQQRFDRELEKGKEPNEILEEIEYDYGMIEHTRERR